VLGHRAPALLFDADPARHDDPGADVVDTVDTGRVWDGTRRGRISVFLPESEAADVAALHAGSGLLVARRGPNAGFRCLLDRSTIVVGRHPDSDVVLDGVTVSRRHAEFRRDGAEFVVDVGSFNGTYVNRTPVHVAVLADGDEVQIGKFRLVFRAGPPRGSAAFGDPCRLERLRRSGAEG